MIGTEIYSHSAFQNIFPHATINIFTAVDLLHSLRYISLQIRDVKTKNESLQKKKFKNYHAHCCNCEGMTQGHINDLKIIISK